MIEELFKNPTWATVIGMLLTALGLLAKGTFVSGVSAEKKLLDCQKVYTDQLAEQKRIYEGQLNQLREDFEARLEENAERLHASERMGHQWMQVAMQTTGSARELLDIAKERLKEEKK
jgi:DNA-binding transcriptional regulator YiaG